MNDNMNELTQFSPYAGKLWLQKVPGNMSGKREAENNADAGVGIDRDMYAYAPVSGCPDSKQCQVLMVLRDGSDEASAREIMERFHLDSLSEEKHFLLLFPNPLEGGWNYAEDPERENDMDYLIRSFAVLRTAELGVNGFNGMVFYIAGSRAASAMLMTMAARRPINVPAMMISDFPKEYHIPADALHIETAAWTNNPEADRYLREANGVSRTEQVGDVEIAYGRNPNVRLLTSEEEIDAQSIRTAWEHLFSETRRWQNDTYGTYQARTNFTQRGFTAHVGDTSLGVNNGFAHTWYEYVPPMLRGTQDRAPLLFYFHGGGCVPLYGAEQSCWHDVADDEGFIVVYPKASQRKMWNAWNDAGLLSDRDFFLALIEHVDKNVHPVDRSRIYVSGFSMGGMMSNALACSLPDVIAAAAPCNAYNEGYFSSFAAMEARRGKDNHDIEKEAAPSPTRQEADAKKAAFDYRVPVFQISGLLDQKWPIPSEADGRLLTFSYWKKYNNIPDEPFVQDNRFESGLTADDTTYEGEDQRFLHHRWFTRDESGESLYELFLAKRMPHALDVRAPRFAWRFLKRFSRTDDGELKIAE